MRLLRHLLRTGADVVQYGVRDRHYGLVVVLMLAAAIVLIGLTVHTVAPIALYPFA